MAQSSFVTFVLTLAIALVAPMADAVESAFAEVDARLYKATMQRRDVYSTRWSEAATRKRCIDSRTCIVRASGSPRI